MTWQTPTGPFPSIEEAIRWWIRAHFGPCTLTSTSGVFYADLYQSFLDAGKATGMPIVSPNRFSAAINVLIPAVVGFVVDAGARRGGRRYALAPLEGVVVSDASGLGRGGVRTLFQQAQQDREGVQVWDVWQQETRLRRDRHAFLASMQAHGLVSTLTHARKLASVETEPNETRCTELPVVTVYRMLKGAAAPVDHNREYLDFLNLLRWGFVVEFPARGVRRLHVRVERYEQPQEAA